jgi:hypothetical protein
MYSLLYNIKTKEFMLDAEYIPKSGMVFSPNICLAESIFPELFCVNKAISLMEA